MRRRDLLIESSRAALGAFLISPGEGSIVTQKSRSPRDVFLESRLAEWERRIPEWLQDARLPGVAMLLIDDGKVFWQREFGVKDVVSKEPVDKDTVFAAYGSAGRKSGIVIMSNGDNFLPFYEKLKLDLEFFTHFTG